MTPRLLLVLALTALPGPAALGGDPQPPPGMTIVRETLAGPNVVHVVTVARSRRDVMATDLGGGQVYGTATVSQIVRATQKARGRKALVAVNGSFFHIKPGKYYGDPRGLQILDGEFVSSDRGRTSNQCLWFDRRGAPHVDKVTSRFVATWPDGATTAFSLNEERSDDEAVLFSPRMATRATKMGPPTTRTSGGTEVVLVPVSGGARLAPGRKLTCKVASVSTGDQPIVAGQLILSLGPKLTAPAVKPGSVVTLRLETSPSLKGVRTAIGSGSVRLVKKGKVVAKARKGKRARRHPRTFFGWNATKLLFFVVEGRSKRSRGMTYPEMAAVAKRHGATDAVELDGGGSSTLWCDGRVLNRPSDGGQRRVGNALILFERKAH